MSLFGKKPVRALTDAPRVPQTIPPAIEIPDATPEELASQRYRQAAKFVRRAGRALDAKLRGAIACTYEHAA